MARVARRLAAGLGWSLILLGIACTLWYPAELWWKGRVLANEVGAVEGFEIVDHNDRTLSLLRTNGVGRVVLADLTVAQIARPRGTPARDLEAALRRTGRRVGEQQARSDHLDADVIAIVGENVESRTVQVRLELYDSDVLGWPFLLFYVTAGFLMILVGRFVRSFAD